MAAVVAVASAASAMLERARPVQVAKAVAETAVETPERVKMALWIVADLAVMVWMVLAVVAAAQECIRTIRIPRPAAPAAAAR